MQVHLQLTPVIPNASVFSLLEKKMSPQQKVWVGGMIILCFINLMEKQLDRKYDQYWTGMWKSDHDTLTDNTTNKIFSHFLNVCICPKS